MSLTLRVSGQSIPESRRTDWTKAGLERPFDKEDIALNILQFGASNRAEIPCDSALNEALMFLKNKNGTIEFPDGVYLFYQTIRLPSGVMLKGSGSSQLLFDLGGVGDCIQIHGKRDTLTAMLAAHATKDANVVHLTDPNGLKIGDYIRITLHDQEMVTSSWAKGSVGQIVKITDVFGNLISIDQPLRMDFPTNLSPRIERILPTEFSGLACLQLIRKDSTAQQTSMVDFQYAVNSKIVNCVFSKSNFAHIAVSYSSRVLIEGSYFEEAFDYGPGGHGYGIVLQFSTGLSLVQNNIFNKLRHAVLLQAGCNGNVIAYNHSLTPIRTEFPSDASGDMVLHGNYPFLNLFEGNSVQQIYIDNSHGINGPYNTIFRNRVSGYGIVMSYPYSPFQNLVGNEITRLTNGFYLTGGTGLLEAQNNVNGVITPAGSVDLKDTSYFFTSPPIYLKNWWHPTFGPPIKNNSRQNPAEIRWSKYAAVVCAEPGLHLVEARKWPIGISIIPNPNHGQFEVSSDVLLRFVVIRSSTGSLLYLQEVTESSSCQVTFENYPPGIYWLEAHSANGISRIKWMKFD